MTLAILLLLLAAVALLVLVLLQNRAAQRAGTKAAAGGLRDFSDLMVEMQRASADSQDKRLAELSRQMEAMTLTEEQKLDQMRAAMERSLGVIREDNGRRLEQMRETVDEKLQQTLEERISRSFKDVSDRLEEVYRGLGEMRRLAGEVDDLSRVLSNVKTRGMLGEIQLGAILSEILAPEQYAENVRTRSRGSERVEFAIRLPGSGDGTIWLPIDAKFPGDTYRALEEAYDSRDKVRIDAAGRKLETAIRKAARDIHEKYVEPPETTDFAIMFLPIEGLYAEVVRRGLVETLQRDCKVNIAGPTTMAALLNSLQMGFRTLEIRRHSSEVWDVLAAVRSEFTKFGEVLDKTQQRIDQAGRELDTLVGVRTRSINRTLRRLDEHRSQSASAAAAAAGGERPAAGGEKATGGAGNADSREHPAACAANAEQEGNRGAGTIERRDGEEAR
ncbi:MAG: DNA recombination protein RmuC [Anaerovoracaceae bacterium]|jgi:DNA recombination protein RmuC